MRIKNSQEIKSAVIKISDIEDFASEISKMYTGDENVSIYSQKPEFNIEQKDGFELEFDNKREFIDYLKSNLGEVKSFRITFWGKEQRVSLICKDTQTSFYIETQNEERSLGYIKKINRIFKEKSWNNITHKNWIQLPLTLIIFTALLSIAYALNKQYMKENFLIVYASMIVTSNFITIPILKYLPKIYPNLVLKKDGEIYGRIFKKDFTKIVIGVLSLIIIPYFVNILSK